jgi:hypothetical protein
MTKPLPRVERPYVVPSSDPSPTAAQPSTTVPPSETEVPGSGRDGAP